MYLCYLKRSIPKHERSKLYSKILDKKLKIKNMSRQLNFYATDADRKIIADILREHFGEMIEVLCPKITYNRLKIL